MRRTTTGKSRRAYGRAPDKRPPARSPVYDPPNILVPTRAGGGHVRGPDGYISDVIPSEGLLTCKEMERELVELARENGVAATESNIDLVEEGQKI